MSQFNDGHPSRDEGRLGRTEAELAERWGISTRTLQRWRRDGRGPDFLRIGRRVIYPLADIAAFEDAARTPRGGGR